MIRLLELLGAYLLDILWGEPRCIPHPVVIMGRAINKLEKLLRPAASRNSRREILAGTVLVVVMLAGVYSLSRGVLYLVALVHPIMGHLVSVALLSTTLAARSLAQAAMEVYGPLERGDLPGARQALSQIVGRDTDHLAPEEVTRATVETVAENIVDGLTAPLFFAFLGGAPLALVYKAVNTMDSMVGYKNQRYLYFGRAAAKVDDLFNYLPARLTFFSILVAGRLIGCKAVSWRPLWQQAQEQPSPNSGFSEAMVAGLLKVRLGGENRYQGILSCKPYMGQDLEALDPEHIKKSIEIMYVSELCFFLFFAGAYTLVHFYKG